MDKKMQEARLENLCYGSLISMVVGIIAGVALYFGGTLEIMWLAIAGFVVAAIAYLIAFSDFSHGLTVVLTSVIIFVVYTVFKDKFINKLPEAISGWLTGNGSADVYFVARIMVVLLVVAAVMNLITSLNAKQDLHELSFKK